MSDVQQEQVSSLWQQPHTQIFSISSGVSVWTGVNRSKRSLTFSEYLRFLLERKNQLNSKAEGNKSLCINNKLFLVHDTCSVSHITKTQNRR